MAGRVGVVGSLMVDLVTTAERMPDAGETLAATGFATGAGGKGANQAVAAARLGAAVTMVGCVGDDAFGRSTRDGLRKNGIDARHVHVLGGETTGVASIFVTPDGENRILINGGANGRLSPAHVDAAADDLARCDLVLVQLEIPLETVEHLIDRARDAGVPLLLNPAPATGALRLDRLGAVAFFVPNQTELAILTAMPTATVDAAANAARRVIAAGIGTVVVTLGADGALLVTADGATPVPPVPVRAVDTTGAGDAFVGAFAAHRAAGVDVPAALGRAAAYAAHSVTGAGAQSSFADQATFNAFLARAGVA